MREPLSDNPSKSTTSTTHTKRPIKVKTLGKSLALRKLEDEKNSASKLPVKVQKQRINSLKQEQELILRELAAPAVGEVLGKALELALAGDRNMIRLILELHMSKPQAQDDTSGGKNQVNILVQNLTDKTKTKVKEVINVEATPAGDDRHSEEYAEVYPPAEEASSDNGDQQADGSQGPQR